MVVKQLAKRETVLSLRLLAIDLVEKAIELTVGRQLL